VYAGVPSRWANSDLIEKCLREIWSPCGEIETVELLQAKSVKEDEMKPRTVAARVRFTKSETVTTIINEEPILKIPNETYRQFKNKQSIDEFMDVRAHENKANEVLALLEADKAAEIERRLQARESGPDEDGFITVTYKRKAVNQNPRKSDAAIKRSRKLNHQVTGAESQDDFYRFQAKRQRLEALRSAVQADKERAAKVAAHRRSKFKPN